MVIDIGCPSLQMNGKHIFPSHWVSSYSLPYSTWKKKKKSPKQKPLISHSAKSVLPILFRPDIFICNPHLFRIQFFMTSGDPGKTLHKMALADRPGSGIQSLIPSRRSSRVLKATCRSVIGDFWCFLTGLLWQVLTLPFSVMLFCGTPDPET